MMIDIGEIVERLGPNCQADVRVLVYVLEHADMNSLFFGSMSSVAKQLDVAPASVARAFKWLKDNNVIELLQPGVWRVLIANKGVIDSGSYMHDDDETCVTVPKLN